MLETSLCKIKRTFEHDEIESMELRLHQGRKSKTLWIVGDKDANDSKKCEVKQPYEVTPGYSDPVGTAYR